MTAPDSPMGNGYNSLLPAWARTVAYLGFPIAVAIFLLLQDAGYLNSPRTIQDQVSAARYAKAMSLLEAQDLAMREHRIRQEDLIRLLATGLEVMCQNNAKSQAERNNCATIKASARYTSP